MIKAFQFRVDLLDAQPSVSRTFIIPAETTFLRLHDTLQFVMGWKDTHFFEFQGMLKTGLIKIVEDEEYFEEFHLRLNTYRKQLEQSINLHEYDYRWYERAQQLALKKVTFKLPSYFKEVGDTITYLYDFGDDWRHLLTLEAIIEDYPVGHPTLLTWEGACPPENVGGVGGYAEFYEAWHNPKHPEHEAMHVWAGGRYKETIDINWLNGFMANILKLKKIK